MTGVSVFSEIKKVVKRIDQEVESVNIDDVDARDLISVLSREGGGIDVMGDNFEPIEEEAGEVKQRSSPRSSYGLDGSTTKDLSFNNGLTFSVSVASTGVVGSDTLDQTSKKSTVCVSMYFEKEDINIQFESSENTEIIYQQMPNDKKNTNRIPDWLTDISRLNAEGTHFENISSDIDSPLFVDGPLLPATLMIWTGLENTGKNQNTPMRKWSEYVWSCLQSYINGIENCVINKNPVYGIQKSTTSTRIIEAIEKKSSTIQKEDIVWRNDATLFNSALEPEKKGSIITYTPWYIEKTFKLGSFNENIPPLKGYNEINLNLGNYKDYRRAFFFVKPPTDTTVYRVGVPTLVFNYMNREEVRDIALNEMIKQYSEPLPVVVADEKVRIPKTLRDRLRRIITAKSHKDKNEQRNYK